MKNKVNKIKAQPQKDDCFIELFVRSPSLIPFKYLYGVLYKVKFAYEQVAHQAGVHPGFCSMERLRVFYSHPEWVASASQGYPRH